MNIILNRQRRAVAYNILALLFIALLPLGSYSVQKTQPAHADASSGFVTRSGAQLRLNGSQFRFAGANIYWLGLNDGAQSYPSPYRIEDALTVANEMGVTVVRAHSLGISVGCALCVEPTLDNFNATAFQHIDYALKAAHDHGLRLIIPFTDNYHYYHGGKHTFTDWRGISDENQFYSNSTVINDFKHYIGMLLTHVNVYTGVAYKDDPTIIAWETGNELLPPSSWTRNIADYIKSVDANHLVMDGNYGIDPTSLPSANVDIYSDHFYPPNIRQANSDARLTQNANKAFVIGEYDWQTSAGDALQNFLATTLANTAIAGDIFWNIWPHNDTYGYLHSGDAVNLTYPGDTSDRRNRIQIIRTHAYTLNGLPVPADGIPGAPLITSIVGNQLAWRGAILGDTYSVERSTSVSGPWNVVCDRCTTDYATPWTDNTQPTGESWYRVRAFNRAGVAGGYSNPYSTLGKSSIVDDLNDWSMTFSHTANLHFDTSNPSKFRDDTSRAFRWSVNASLHDEIVWKLNGLTSFTAIAYFWPGEPVSHFSFYTSHDAVNWTLVSPTITGGDGDWRRYTYTLSNLSNASYVKVQWNNFQGQSWSPQLGQIIMY